MAESPQVRASLFVTCLVDQLFPEVGEAVVGVLRRQGVRVDFPAGSDLLRSAVVQFRVSSGRGGAWQAGSRRVRG